MRALVWKELRELRWAAVALVGCAVVIAAGNALYDRLYVLNNNMPEFGLKIWEVISVALALLAGSATFAREGRERAVFLTAWPQSRTRVWLVKVLVSFVVTAAVAVIGTLVCLAATRLAFVGYDVQHDFSREFGWLILYGLLLFLFGLMWSGLIRSVLGAATLGFVTFAALGYGLLLFYMLYLPNNWGPFVANVPQRSWQVSSLPLLIPLFVGWWGFTRYPLLEGKRRVLVALGLFVGLVLLGNATLIAQMAVGYRPVLNRSVAETGLVGGGRYRYYLMAAHGKDPGGLWVEPAGGGKTKLVARGKVYRYDANREGLDFSHTAMSPGGGRYTNWTVQFPSLRLKRLPDAPVGRPGAGTEVGG
jgi:ABC-type transport system involved in multi-copper enzyme maturation permease subunit